jgi:threonine/homoserine/homoserine lactone efflux protein
VLTQLAAFLGVSALVIVTPGQDTALTIRNALLGGRRRGVATALGVATGQTVWTVATSAGLAAILVASEPAFVALRVAGAAYLVVLGLQALWAAVRGAEWAPNQLPGGAGRGSAAAGFRQGLLSNLANPKMALFFTSLLPQFAPRGGPSFLTLLLLGLVFALMTLVWLSAYAATIAKAGDILRRPRVRRTIDAVTGAVFVLFGLRLATERR